MAFYQTTVSFGGRPAKIGDAVLVNVGGIVVPGNVVELTSVGTGVQTVRYFGHSVDGTDTSGLGDGVSIAPTFDASAGVVNGVLTLASNKWCWAPASIAAFCDGADGAVTLGAGTTTLTRDMAYTTLVVPAGSTLKTANFKVVATISITNAGVIDVSGPNGAAGGSGGAALAGGTFTGPILGGGDGTTTVGVPGGNCAAGGTATGDGGAGGAGGAGAGGSGGTHVGDSTWGSGHTLFDLSQSLNWGFATPFAGQGTAAGGGGGGGDLVNTGGGGGAGGGLMALVAPVIVNTGTISANGGAGGSPAAGNTGGGGGGGGGLIWLVGTLTNTGTITASGGVAGAKHGTGANGTAGAAGTVVRIGS